MAKSDGSLEGSPRATTRGNSWPICEAVMILYRLLVTLDFPVHWVRFVKPAECDRMGSIHARQYRLPQDAIVSFAEVIKQCGGTEIDGSNRDCQVNRVVQSSSRGQRRPRD